MDPQAICCASREKSLWTGPLNHVCDIGWFSRFFLLQHQTNSVANSVVLFWNAMSLISRYLCLYDTPINEHAGACNSPFLLKYVPSQFPKTGKKDVEDHIFESWCSVKVLLLSIKDQKWYFVVAPPLNCSISSIKNKI